MAVIISSCRDAGDDEGRNETLEETSSRGHLSSLINRKCVATGQTGGKIGSGLRSYLSKMRVSALSLVLASAAQLSARRAWHGGHLGILS